jgi:hypothetical protein
MGESNLYSGDALKRIQAKLRRLAKPDPRPLLEEWERILYQGVERRAKAGLDCYERPMKTTLREQGIGGQWRTLTSAKGKRYIVLMEQAESLPNGPPLQPNAQTSRILERRQTKHETIGGRWVAMLSWNSFDASNGRSVLGMHANPDDDAPYPRRDVISKVADKDVALARKALVVWIKGELRKP